MPHYEPQLKILLAEDNPLSRKLLSFIVKKCGHAIVCVEDGQQAVMQVHAEEFDVVLMDIEMPVMNGLEATQQIRASQSPRVASIPVIGISAHDDPEMLAQCTKAGMNYCLSKSVTQQEMALALKAAEVFRTGRLQSLAASSQYQQQYESRQHAHSHHQHAAPIESHP
jgi:CheY-like chemotaxis protein